MDIRSRSNISTIQNSSLDLTGKMAKLLLKLRKLVNKELVCWTKNINFVKNFSVHHQMNLCMSFNSCMI